MDLCVALLARGFTDGYYPPPNMKEVLGGLQKTLWMIRGAQHS